MQDANMAVMSINAQLAAEDVKAAVGLENKIKAAMKAVIAKNWMDTSDDSMMRAALAAVLMDVGKDSEDGKVLVRTMDGLRKISAFLAAVQAGLSVDLSSIETQDDNFTPLPLIPWWKEAKKAA